MRLAEMPKLSNSGSAYLVSGLEFLHQAAVAAAEHDAGIRIAPRQVGDHRHALGGFIERGIAARIRYRRADRPAQNHDAIGRAARGVPRGETLLQRQDQRIAEWRQARDPDEQDAEHNEPLAGAGEPREHQDDASGRDQEKQVGGHSEEAQNLGEC